jgi:hypothetical protein
VFLDSGERQYSGTGRNRQTTRLVEPFNNYSMLPLNFTELVSARGKEMKPAKDLKIYSPYWAEFAPLSSYEVYFQSKSVAPLFVTRTGNKPVGGVVQDKSGSGKGALILLPILHYDRAAFIEKQGEKSVWKKEALAFGQKLMAGLLEIDKALTSGHQVTPPPEWAGQADYRLSTERELEAEVTEKTKSIEAFQAQRSELLEKLERERGLRKLLFETGPALEDVILQALSLLGLKAERYKDSESEFDVVFTWKEHRFLGEAVFELRPAVEAHARNAANGELHREDFALLATWKVARGFVNRGDFTVWESGRVKARRFLRVLVEPKANGVLCFCVAYERISYPGGRISSPYLFPISITEECPVVAADSAPN